MLLVAAFGLSLRLMFQALAGDTFDYDEFVLLLLARATAHGAEAYRDFLFFHPPGALTLLRVIVPLTDWWWPLSRIGMALIDTVSALLVWRLGSALFGRRTGLIAGLLYGASPLALVAGDRVGQDPLITVLGLAGLSLLVLRREWWAPLLAGGCLAVAVWIKYPALYFLPIFLLAAPRRSPLMVGAALCAGLALFLPWQGEWHTLYRDTVTFQRTRWLMPAEQRLLTTALFWGLLNPLAPIGLLRARRLPLWLPAAFLLGLGFALSSQVYYHYFVVVVPFGALLGAPVLARLRFNAQAVVAAGVALALSWGMILQRGGASPLYVTAAHLSAIMPAVRYLNRHTAARSVVLADQFEYAYLARRPAFLQYFWNVGVLVNARALEHETRGVHTVVLSSGASSGYPAGFTSYVNRRGSRIDTPSATIWLLGHGR